MPFQQFTPVTISSYERYSVSCNLSESQKSNIISLLDDDEIGCSHCFGLKPKILDPTIIRNNRSVKETWIQLETMLVIM